MSKLLELPRSKNSLIDAYDAVKRDQGALADNDVAAIYARHFVTVAPPTWEQPPDFKRVSLTDPTIRTIVRANTSF